MSRGPDWYYNDGESVEPNDIANDLEPGTEFALSGANEAGKFRFRVEEDGTATMILSPESTSLADRIRQLESDIGQHDEPLRIWVKAVSAAAKLAEHDATMDLASARRLADVEAERDRLRGVVRWLAINAGIDAFGSGPDVHELAYGVYVDRTGDIDGKGAPTQDDEIQGFIAAVEQQIMSEQKAALSSPAPTQETAP